MRKMMVLGKANIHVGMIFTDHTCPACPISPPSNDRVFPDDIPIFSSEDEARKNGWVFTVNRDLCTPDMNCAWVCPECWGKYKEEVKDNQCQR